MEQRPDPYQQAQLILRFLRNEATSAERNEVENWLKDDERDGEFLKQLQNEQGLHEEYKFLHPSEREKAWQKVQQAVRPATKSIWPRVAAAAVLIISFSIGGYLLVHPKIQNEQLTEFKEDISPGHNQATLTLANGQKVLLTKGLSGKLAQQGNTQIQVNSGNAIAYINTSRQGDIPARLEYNTLSTVKGEKSPYPLILVDGTKVWLNAESSITYPTIFSGNKRMVKVTGEVYFEVAHNNKQTFTVQSPGQITEDIGTHFDIMAYADEPASKVTLGEGAVKVNGKLLKPGEQTVNANGDIKVIEANLDVEFAWQRGYFRFNNASIATVMRELGRWYNIDVVYEGKPTTEHFYAKISRYRNISEVLHILEGTKSVKFKIEERRVTVSSKL